MFSRFLSGVQLGKRKIKSKQKQKQLEQQLDDSSTTTTNKTTKKNIATTTIIENDPVSDLDEYESDPDLEDDYESLGTIHDGDINSGSDDLDDEALSNGNGIRNNSNNHDKNHRKGSSSTQKSTITTHTTSSTSGEEMASIMQENPLLPEELCEIPTFLNTKCCDSELIEETRRLLKKKFKKRPESIAYVDYERMLNDDWTVSRFLLRCRQEPKRAAKLMEQCGRFRLEFGMATSKLSDFPIEFHKAGGLFRYAPDRVGNQTLFMRVKMHKRCPELSKIMKSFILCVLEDCDRANNGRGTAVIFDLTDCGLQNVDPGFLFWLVYSFRNYCPKGLSYIIVYNLPWILNATARLALSWLSSTNKRRLRFASGDGIRDFIAPENLPDYLGGTCKLNYRRVPPGSKPAEETAHENGLTKEEARKIKEVYAKFLKNVDGGDIELDEEGEEIQGHFDETTKIDPNKTNEGEKPLKKAAA